MPIPTGYHSRGYLPHLKVNGGSYFVTFRLADSLPREVIIRLKENRDDLLRRAAESAAAVSKAAAVPHRAFAVYAAEVDAVLDRHAGAAWLRDARLAGLVADALRHFADDRYVLPAWCVMPNHVHCVVRPLGDHTLDTLLHSWKSFTATAANRLLRRTGQPFWQHESYDHWIRDDADQARCIDYTEQNPVKAGLCAHAAEWPWSSARKVRRHPAGICL